MMTAAPVGAETVDKLAYLTFNRSVQVPGALLDAGSYRFRLADATSGRQVVQVLSRDGSIVHSMFLTRNDWRNKATDDPTVTFRETPAGVPPEVRSLFYGGETRGYEFVYVKGTMMKPEPAPAQPPITYTPIPATAAPAARGTAPEFTVEPGPAFTPEPAAAAPISAEQVPAAPAELPRTASPLPLVALGGLLSLLAGLGTTWFGRARG
jgi:hypothetical protein